MSAPTAASASAAGPASSSTTASTQVRSPMSAASAAAPSATARTSRSTCGSTTARSPTRAVSAARPSARAPTCCATSGCTRARSPTPAASAARPSSGAPCSSSTSASTRARSPTSAPTAARPSAAARTSSGTCGPTRARSPLPAAPAARPSARVPSSSSTRGSTPGSSVRVRPGGAAGGRGQRPGAEGTLGRAPASARHPFGTTGTVRCVPNKFFLPDGDEEGREAAPSPRACPLGGAGCGQHLKMGVPRPRPRLGGPAGCPLAPWTAVSSSPVPHPTPCVWGRRVVCSSASSPPGCSVRFSPASAPAGGCLRPAGFSGRRPCPAFMEFGGPGVPLLTGRCSWVVASALPCSSPTSSPCGRGGSYVSGGVFSLPPPAPSWAAGTLLLPHVEE
uniref:Zinc finger and SCAN domain-containing protein 21 isoform X2-like n=1 Tax=Sus scrofa TaxID=9823 RepID=A0A481CTG1_PIG